MSDTSHNVFRSRIIPSISHLKELERKTALLRPKDIRSCIQDAYKNLYYCSTTINLMQKRPFRSFQQRILRATCIVSSLTRITPKINLSYAARYRWTSLKFDTRYIASSADHGRIYRGSEKKALYTNIRSCGARADAVWERPG